MTEFDSGAYVTQYAVLCDRDGKVRDISTPDRKKAERWAAERDQECGVCRVENAPHVVVSRQVSQWRASASSD